PLASQERHAENRLKEAEENINEIKEKPIRLGKKDSKNKWIEKQCKIEEAVKARDNLKVDYEEKVERREKVQKAKREMGKIHHPIDLKTGKLQTANEMEGRFN